MSVFCCSLQCFYLVLIDRFCTTRHWLSSLVSLFFTCQEFVVCDSLHEYLCISQSIIFFCITLAFSLSNWYWKLITLVYSFCCTQLMLTSNRSYVFRRYWIVCVFWGQCEQNCACCGYIEQKFVCSGMGTLKKKVFIMWEHWTKLFIMWEHWIPRMGMNWLDSTSTRCEEQFPSQSSLSLENSLVLTLVLSRNKSQRSITNSWSWHTSLDLSSGQPG